MHDRRQSHDEISLINLNLGNPSNISDKILIDEISLVDDDVLTNKSDNDGDMQNLEK